MSDTLDLQSHVIAISIAIVAKKLLVGRNKKTACVKEICLLGVVCKVSNGKKTLFGETFCFTEKLLLSILNLVP